MRQNWCAIPPAASILMSPHSMLFISRRRIAAFLAIMIFVTTLAWILLRPHCPPAAKVTTALEAQRTPSGVGAIRIKSTSAQDSRAAHPFARRIRPNTANQVIVERATATAKAFAAWIAAWKEAPLSERPELLSHGLILSEHRREALKSLIIVDPRHALTLALPFASKEVLPAEIQANLESRVDARGNLNVTIACLKSGSQTLRAAEIGATIYRAFVFGRRENMATKERLPIHGIAIDDVLAVDELPLRPLSKDEGLMRGSRSKGEAILRFFTFGCG